MRKFNEEDYKSMKPYEEHFRVAIKSRYATGVTMDESKAISVVYRECLNRQANLSCGSCVLTMLTSVGRLYFAYKESRKNKTKNKKKNNEDKS